MLCPSLHTENGLEEPLLLTGIWYDQNEKEDHNNKRSRHALIIMLTSMQHENLGMEFNEEGWV